MYEGVMPGGRVLVSSTFSNLRVKGLPKLVPAAREVLTSLED
jgi:hypothetical protein